MAKDTFRVSRRGFLQTTAAGVGAATLAQYQAWAQTEGRERLSEYTPEFFTSTEWPFIIAACARLIPEEGDGPGALACHVPVFIDRQLLGEYGKASRLYMDGPHDPDAIAQRGFQSPYTPAEIYRRGIAELNDWCREHHNKVFSALDERMQDDLLTALDKGEISLPSFNGKLFFDFLLQNSKEGYFADPTYGGNYGMQSWVYIGFPGARGAFLEWAQAAQHDKPYPLGPVDIAGNRK